MALQKEKKERERELYLKTPKAQKFKLKKKKKLGETPKVEKLRKRCENGKMWESGEENKEFLHQA